MSDKNLLVMLGEIKGKLELMIDTQELHGQKLDALTNRLGKVENKAAMNGFVTGSIAAVGISLIRQKLGL